VLTSFGGWWTVLRSKGIFISVFRHIKYLKRGTTKTSLMKRPKAALYLGFYPRVAPKKHPGSCRCRRSRNAKARHRKATHDEFEFVILLGACLLLVLLLVGILSQTSTPHFVGLTSATKGQNIIFRRATSSTLPHHQILQPRRCCLYSRSSSTPTSSRWRRPIFSAVVRTTLGLLEEQR
jgi:hypothetical protein